MRLLGPGLLPAGLGVRVEAVARILIIDDDTAVRATLRRILERAGHTVVEAADGRRGVEQHRQAPADLVITDVFMPEQDGLQTIRQLKREAPGVKIIAISGGNAGGTLDLREHAEMMGASKSLAKPFEPQAVLAAVREVLGGS